MPKGDETKVNTIAENCMLVSDEYSSTKNALYSMLKVELRCPDITTLFILGVNGAIVSTHYIGETHENIVENLLKIANESIDNYIKQNGYTPGKTYYGEYLENDEFDIGTEKPEWEDGSWGKKMS